MVNDRELVLKGNDTGELEVITLQAGSRKELILSDLPHQRLRDVNKPTSFLAHREALNHGLQVSDRVQGCLLHAL